MSKKGIKHFFDKIELLVDKVIPPLVLLLLFIIIIEFGFHDIAEHYEFQIKLADSIIVAVFIIDLIYKYIRVRNIPKFVKHFWLDILAVFPFFLLFRAFEGVTAVLRIGETTERGQKLLHEGLELQKEGARLVQEIEKAARVGKEATLAGRFARFIRPVTRLPRILKIVPQQTRRKHADAEKYRIRKTRKH